MVGSELNALTISNLFSASTEPSSRKYVTLQDINIPKLNYLPKKLPLRNMKCVHIKAAKLAKGYITGNQINLRD
jgi:hypothetical protein